MGRSAAPRDGVTAGRWARSSSGGDRRCLDFEGSSQTGSWNGEHPKALIMTTALVLTRHSLREDRGTEGNYLLYGSTASEITEETEYIKQIRSTLAKVQPLLCKNRRIANGILDSKPHLQESGLDPDQDALVSSYTKTLEKVEDMEQELSRVNKENEWLQIKLEASRAAGLESVKNASSVLREEYNQRRDDLKKRHEGVIHTIKARKLEQEETLEQRTENLLRMNAALKEKYSRIEELEKRVERMEEEKKTLKDRQWLLKGKLQQMMLKAEDTNRFVKPGQVGGSISHDAAFLLHSCVKVQTEISTLQEQISHLDHVIHSQHQNLRALIHQIEDLNNELRLQDERIESLKEKIGMLQAKNEELKYRVQFWSAQSRSRVSKAVSAKLDGASPYSMVSRLRK